MNNYSPEDAASVVADALMRRYVNEAIESDVFAEGSSEIASKASFAAEVYKKSYEEAAKVLRH